MVDNGILPQMNDPWVILGQPISGGILIVCDHASNHVPEEIELGIDRRLLSRHIAYDIGVTGVATFLVELSGCAAFLATNSRLVVDLNRYPEDASAIPPTSDGIAASSRSIRANGSDLPDSSRAGTVIAGQCAIRVEAVSGPPGRWSG